MRVVFLMIIMVIAVSASILVLKFSNQMTPPPQQIQVAQPQPEAPKVQAVDVLVARQEIPIGTVIQEGMIDRQPWPSHLVLQGFMTAGSPEANAVVGMVTRAPFQAREPLIVSKLAKPNDPSFLAASLPEGKRAITVAVDAVSAVAGYIFPGDRVDVLLTHNLTQELSGEQNGGANGHPSVTEVLVANLKVIGVNIRGSEAPGQVQVPSSLSLEVTEAEAQKLRLAEKVGTISMTLRSLKDGQKVALPKPTIINELSQASLPRSAGEVSVNIVRGTGSQQEKQTLGMSGGVRAISPGDGGVPMPVQR